MIPEDKLVAILNKFDSIEKSMSTVSETSDIIRLSKEHGELRPVAEKARELLDTRKQIVELKELSEGDDEGNGRDGARRARAAC